VPMQYAGPDADARLQALKEVADEVGATVNQIVVAWMLQSDPRVLPIIAGSQPGQVTEKPRGSESQTLRRSDPSIGYRG
jgi:aryl-alcohol dehydrogenase-like predicted oxidoreductase